MAQRTHPAHIFWQFFCYGALGGRSYCQMYGKPDYFLTMTANPAWKEIQEQLYPGQVATEPEPD